MMHDRGFGLVTRRELQDAELFWRDLAGPRPRRWSPYGREGRESSFAEDAAEDRARDDLRAYVIEQAQRKNTFVSEAAVTRALDTRATRAELQQLFDAAVAASAPPRRSADARGADTAAQLTIYWGLIDANARRILALLEGDRFRCASASNAVVVHTDVVEGMRATWTRSGEALTVHGVCAGAAPADCPNPHAALHGASGATSSNAAHFSGLGDRIVRTVEIAGLFGVDLRTVAQADRPATAVKTMPTAAPLQALSFVAIRKSGRRAIHVARETPRRVESWVENQPWLCLPFVPGLTYRLFKRRFWEASFHRQWGTLFTISWVAGLTNFYRDNTGLSLGVGDVSHVVGEVMTDHGSHRVGKDVDCYVLEDPPAGGAFPVAFWCSGPRANLELRELGAPAAGAARPQYTVPAGGAAIVDPRRTTLFDRYATILAYCVATQGGVDAAVWHGAPALGARALAIAQDAWDRTVAANAGTTASPGWRAAWGVGPATRAAIVAPRANLLIGDGSGSYNRSPGWPLHQDHIHVRLR